MTCLSNYLKVLAPDIPSQLVSASILSTLQGRLQDLPGELSNYFGFECRLAESQDQVDFQLSVLEGSIGSRLLAGREPEYAMPAHYTERPDWIKLECFARRWMDGEIPNIAHIWLGFDMDAGSEPLSPLIHIRTDKRSPAEILDLLEIFRPSDSPIDRTAIRQSLVEAPEMPAYIGFMLARPSAPLRMVLPLPISQALPYLQAIAWPGDQTKLSQYLNLIDTWTPVVGLSLDIGQAVQPQIGLEFLNWTKPGAGRPVWRACLGTLVDLGLCCPEKQRALLAYPSIKHERAQQRPWPQELRTSPQNQAQWLRFLTCSLLHIKLVCHPERPVQAKGYLAIQHGWLNIGAIGAP